MQLAWFKSEFDFVMRINEPKLPIFNAEVCAHQQVLKLFYCYMRLFDGKQFIYAIITFARSP